MPTRRPFGCRRGEASGGVVVLRAQRSLLRQNQWRARQHTRSPASESPFGLLTMTAMPSLRAVSSCSVGTRATTSLRWDSFMNYQIWTSARSVTVRFSGAELGAIRTCHLPQICHGP